MNDLVINIKIKQNKYIYIEYKSPTTNIIVCKINIDANKVDMLNSSNNPINSLVSSIITNVGNILNEYA